MTDFHESAFDDSTQLKLALFKGYIKEWLPVFLTKYGGGRQNFKQVNIFDFFAGPGFDKEGVPGSPVIIVDELKNFCQTNHALKVENTKVKLVFNDSDISKIKNLQSVIPTRACSKSCCEIEYYSEEFQVSIKRHYPKIAAKDSANLIIMDQCGVKHISPELIQQLAACGTTDILFFISSSIIRRFITTPEIKTRFDALDTGEVKTQDYNVIHRFVCDYFKEQLGNTRYYLTPFSIKKGSNIYGIIFGSSSLFGLDKFLKVCWAIDPSTGEANYNIDGDFAWAQKSLFDEYNVIQKEDKFEHDLKEFLKSSPTNHEVYEFSLTHGFMAGKAKEILHEFDQKQELEKIALDSARPISNNAYYIRWEEYDKYPPRVRFSLINHHE